MKLSSIDTIIILNSLLPVTGSVDQIKLIISIKTKLNNSNKAISIVRDQQNMLVINDITEDMYIRDTNYIITLDELNLLKVLANNCNRNGWVTENSLDTIEYIINYTMTND